MKTRIIQHIICVCFVLGLCATNNLQAQNIRDIFGKMPEELLIGVSDNNKVLLTADTMAITIPYTMGEISKKHQSDTELLLQTSEVGTTQIKLLPVATDSTVVCVIKTVCSPYCDSHISFYSTSWQPLPTSDFMPDYKHYFSAYKTPKSGESPEYTLSLQNFSYNQAEFLPNSLTLRITTRKEQQDNRLEPEVSTQLFEWKNNRLAVK